MNPACAVHRRQRRPLAEDQAPEDPGHTALPGRAGTLPRAALTNARPWDLEQRQCLEVLDRTRHPGRASKGPAISPADFVKRLAWPRPWWRKPDVPAAG